MSEVPRKVRRHRKRLALLATLTALGAGLVFVIAASTASLPGSKFEIDTGAAGANLIVDVAGNLDWANVNQTQATDITPAANDDSYQGGVKEDTACPGTTTGSIPPNKSDLLNFGGYFEPEAGGPGNLHVFWRRVQEPSGTTNMDFEFNKSNTDCDGAGPSKNVTRSVGDILLQFDIDQGGSQAQLSRRTWTGTAWSDPPVDLDASGGAIGSINQVPITAANSDGLGAMSARTFGEASFDLATVFDPTKCESFGSAMLKSRSSDAFNSQLKDFIAPIPVNIRNCGQVIIRKVTDPAGSTTNFDYTKAFATDPASANTFQLNGAAGTNVKTFDGVLFGNGSVEETLPLPSGWEFVSLDCSASSGVTVTVNGRSASWTIDDQADVVDCTYTNRARGTIIVKKVTDDGFGPFTFTSATLPGAPFVLTTTAAGEAGSDSDTFANLAVGTYDVDETVPANWNLVSAACSDNSPISAISLQAGETITCTFHDARERGAIEITKTRKHAAAGGSAPHAGVTFTVTGGELPAAGVAVVTDVAGKACVDGLLDGSYTVTESLPAGYHAAGALAKNATVTDEATCASGPKAAVSFVNIPLTNLSVSVDSQVDGGTASTIDCDDNTADQPVATGANGDGSKSITDLEPGTYTCVVVIDP